MKNSHTFGLAVKVYHRVQTFVVSCIIDITYFVMQGPCVEPPRDEGWGWGIDDDMDDDDMDESMADDVDDDASLRRNPP